MEQLSLNTTGSEKSTKPKIYRSGIDQLAADKNFVYEIEICQMNMASFVTLGVHCFASPFFIGKNIYKTYNGNRYITKTISLIAAPEYWLLNNNYERIL